jgi:hypothetical protein
VQNTFPQAYRLPPSDDARGSYNNTSVNAVSLNSPHRERYAGGSSGKFPGGTEAPFVSAHVLSDLKMPQYNSHDVLSVAAAASIGSGSNYNNSSNNNNNNNNNNINSSNLNNNSSTTIANFADKVAASV